MVIVAALLAAIFLVRDLQILVVQSRERLAARFAVYATFLVTGLAAFSTLAGSRPEWADRRFAAGAVGIQAAELAFCVALDRYRLARYGWLGCLLPAPAFLMALFVLGLEVQQGLGYDARDSLALVTGAWLGLVCLSALILHGLNNPWEDRKFARDFAMMTGCTALIFVPLWLS